MPASLNSGSLLLAQPFSCILTLWVDPSPPSHQRHRPRHALLSVHTCFAATARTSASLEWVTDTGAPWRGWIRRRQPSHPETPSSLACTAPQNPHPQALPCGHPFPAQGDSLLLDGSHCFGKCSLTRISARRVFSFNSPPLHSALVDETSVCNYKQDSPPTGMFSESSRKHKITYSNVFWIKLHVFFSSESFIRKALTDVIFPLISPAIKF